MKAFYSFLSIASLAYVGLCAFLYVTQRSLIYYPVKGPDYKNLDSIQLKSETELLNAWVVNPGKAQAILYFGGNAEAVAYNTPMFQESFSHHTVYLTEYRGYGRSTGRPTEQGLYADALNWYDKLRNKHEQISVIGRSLGASVAVYLASMRKVRRLALVTPFDSVEKMAKRFYPFFPVSLLLKDKYNSVDIARLIEAQTLILAAAKDRIVPLSHVQALASAMPPGISKTVILEEVGHNTISDNPMYTIELARHFDLSADSK